MKATFRFLGTGSSMGVPLIGCPCKVCRSSSNKNKRLRVSALIEAGQKRFLIDAGPDFRQQALAYHIDRLDGVLLTHTHYDHIGGLDELRVYNFLQKSPLALLLSEHSFEDLKNRCRHLFPQEKPLNLSAQFEYYVLRKNNGKTTFLDMDLDYFTFKQGDAFVTGYRFKNFAYVSDIKEYDEKILSHLHDLDYLILSAVRKEKSPVQFNFDEAFAFIEKVRPKKTYLMHLAHEIDYEKEEKSLPENVFLSYDGLSLECEI